MPLFEGRTGLNASFQFIGLMPGQMLGSSAAASKKPNVQDTKSRCLWWDAALFAGCLSLSTAFKQHRATASVRPRSRA